MIHKNKPDDFHPKFEVVSCYIENNGKILLLHRQDHKPEGNTWGLPAGKIDAGENEFTAMLREIAEETGIKAKAEELEYLDKVYVKYPDYHFIYHMFRLALSKCPEVKINNQEHKEYKWLKVEDALRLELIRDLDECIKISYKL
jgi:8-oxo-dGTP pyrophosphatase MutT (NUDIX family)